MPVGHEEVQARQLLLAMQERLSRDPFEALGLTNSDPGAVRTAFLALTKIYHPARFARMSPDVQRLSNEVFLGLRGAHDQLTRAQVKVAARTTAVLPTVKQPTTGAPVPGGRTPTGAIPVVRPAPPAATASASAAPPRTGTQGQVVRSPMPAPTTARTTTGSTPVARPGAQTTQPMRPMGNPSDPARPPSRMPSSSPPPASGQTPATSSARFAAVARPATGTSAGGADGEVAAIHELLVQDRLTDARMRLEALVARNPSPKHQAMIHYAKGREAQLAGRRDEARLELLDALDLDRELQLANTALSELLSKRK